MRYETRTFTKTVTYPVFDVGEKVRPISAAADYDEFIVETFHHPMHAGDVALVFIKGRQYGTNSNRWTAAEGKAPEMPANAPVATDCIAYNVPTERTPFRLPSAYLVLWVFIAILAGIFWALA